MEAIAKAFGNPKRLKLLQCLTDGEASVSELEQQCQLSQSAVSQHIAVLKNAGLIECRKEGKHCFYSLADERVAEIAKRIHALSDQAS
jgi:DNA-binding transcriptional ArsR family regulator